MPKIRTVKPELFRHEALFEAEQQYQLPLRLAFIGLFSCCDREGRFRWEPRSLKLDILPYDEKTNFAEVLNALWEAGFVKKYTWQNKCYGHIPSWHQHQSINKNEPASKLPNPEQYDTTTTEIETKSQMLPSSDKHRDLSSLPRYAQALQKAVSALKNLEKYVAEQPINEQNPSLDSHPSKQLSLSEINKAVSTFSALAEKPAATSKNQESEFHIENHANPESEPGGDISILIPTTENPPLPSPLSEMHQQAHAWHDNASAALHHGSALQCHQRLRADATQFG